MTSASKRVKGWGVYARSVLMGAFIFKPEQGHWILRYLRENKLRATVIPVLITPVKAKKGKK